MKKSQPTPTIDETLLAVAEREADSWRMLLVRRGDRPTVIEARTFGAGDETGVSNWLQTQRCGDLRVVLPSAATIVRTVTMPVAAPGQMMAALRLQAEGMFLGSVPLVRIGLGVLDSDSESERQGVIMAWPESQSGVSLGSKLEPITRYVPEPAAIVALASGDHAAVSADRSVGSIAIAMKSGKSGERGLEIRATREAAGSDIEGDEAWREGLRRALVETALNAGMEPSRIGAFVSSLESSAQRSGDRVLMIDPEIKGLLGSKLDVRVAAAEDDDSWWREWAIPLAAATVACGPLGEMAKMRRSEERIAPSRVERFIESYSSPSRALRVALVAFALVGVTPIVAAWMRKQVLEWKMPTSAGKFEVSQREIEHRIALYTELSKRTLPVAKILGDLACCTPDGIEIEQIQLSPTQGVTVRGVAKAQGEKSAAEIVNTMARLMDSSGVFDKTYWRWNTPDGRGIFKFDLEALVARPTLIPDFPEERDWAVKTLSERKYGSGDGDSGSAPASAQASATKPETEKPALAGGAKPAEVKPTEAKPAEVKPTEAKPTEVAKGTEPPAADGAAGSTTMPARGIGRRDPATAPAAGGEPGKPATASTGAGAGGGPSATALANTAIPEPFTDEQLAAMSKEEARALLSDISRARRRQDVDADVRKRLTDDFQRILDHLKK